MCLICFNESDEKCFLFYLKSSLFFLKIFKFLQCQINEKGAGGRGGGGRGSGGVAE